jgi:hypothetical protein
MDGPLSARAILAFRRSGSGAVMYPAFVRGALTAGPEGVRGRVPIMAARCDAR